MNIPQFAQAKQVTLLSITPQTVGVGGLLTPGTTYDIAGSGTFDSWSLTASNGLFEVSAANATITNNQSAKADFTLTFTTIDKAGKVNPNINLFFNSGYVLFQCQCSDASGAKGLLTVYAIIDTLNTGLVEQRNVTTLTCRPCGIVPTFV